MLDNTLNQPYKCRTKNWVEVNDDVRGLYNTNSQIKFKTSMLKSTLCDYSDAYILVSGTITVVGAGADDAARALDRNNKQAISKNFVAMPMYNLIEYRDNYSRTSGSLYQFCRDKPNNVIKESE